MIFLCKIYSSETDFSSLGHSLTTFLFRHILKPMPNKGYKMEKVVRLFRNGRNQAVRLPVEFEFDATQVYIFKEENGDITLSTR